MANEQEIRNLIDTLNEYTDAYNRDEPKISDREWDDLYFKLLQKEKDTGIIFPDSPTQSIREVKSELTKIQHTHLMLSLNKTKNINKIKSFVKKKKFICMGKMDGLTCALRYENGALTAAETRGDGAIGEDILANARRVKNIPLTIDYKDTLEVDGEIICTWKDFEEFSSDYKNPRNFASGSIRLLDPRESEKRNLTFVAWDWIDAPYDTLGEELIELDKLGFDTVPYWDGIETELDNLEEIIEEVKGFCQTWSYPIDGLVFKYDNNKEYHAAGATSHHPNGGLAYKFYDEEVETTVVGVDWTMGRTGCLTPVIKFEPVELEGTIISRSSAHNLSILKSLWGERTGCIGDTVFVYKANQIIPQISVWVVNEDSDKFISPPALCPICGSPTSVHTEEDSGVKTLWCDNPDCEGKLQNRVAHYCDMKKGMAIKGLSKATIEKLIDWGWLNTIKDLYELNLHRSEWIKKPGFGPKSVDNLLAAIENSKKCELWQFISALGIPLIGVSASKQLAAEFGTWANFFNSNQENFIYSMLPNFGEEMESSLLGFDLTLANEIAMTYLSFADPQKKVNSNGLVFCVTGKLNHYKNRSELQTYIESIGGKVTGSVSKNTSYLINNDTTSNTAKNKTAKELSVPVISENEFIELFGLQN